MVRKRLSVYVCPSCGVVASPFHLDAANGKSRSSFRDDRGNIMAGVFVWKVLCWWCREYHPATEVEACMKIPDRKAFPEAANGSFSSALDPGLLKQYSELWGWLTGCDGSTGKRRQPGSLSLKCSAGMVSLTLNDPATGQYCTLNLAGVDDLLLMAEAGLGDGSLPWRPSSYGNGKKVKN